MYLLPNDFLRVSKTVQQRKNNSWRNGAEITEYPHGFHINLAHLVNVFKKKKNSWYFD